jgi:hypothetical protein
MREHPCSTWFKTCFFIVNVNARRITTIVLWALAIVIPGGFALLALWLSFRAAREKALQARPAPRVSVMPTPALQ